MRVLCFACTLAFTGCASSVPQPDPFGYLAVARDPACGTASPVESDPRFTNIVLGPALSEKLLGLLPVEGVELPQCWYSHSDGSLELTSGPFCQPALQAYFRMEDGEWKLQSFREKPEVICVTESQSRRAQDV